MDEYRVCSIEHPTAWIAEVWLEPAAERLEYLPGQYVLLEDREGQVPPRSYSIANAPRPDGLISLLVTAAGGATSTWVHSALDAGDEVTVTGPYGSFVAEPAATRPCVYLSAGSGFAPMRALVEAELEAPLGRSLTLVVSARTEGDVIDRDRLLAWDGSYPQFRFIRTLTRGPGPNPHGRIPGLLPRFCPELADRDVFIAGAPGFVRGCAAAAAGLGAEPRLVRTEPFFVEPQLSARRDAA
jgi:CDP-4-dehydro-6-deoxyglucose reductase, E3